MDVFINFEGCRHKIKTEDLYEQNFNNNKKGICNVDLTASGSNINVFYISKRGLPKLYRFSYISPIILPYDSNDRV